MQRFLVAAVGAALLGSACKVERTPPEYFDHPGWSQTEVSEAGAELQDRILAFGQAIGRRSVTEAMIALAPDPNAVILTPLHGIAIAGTEEIQRAIGGLVASRRAVRLATVAVTVSPQGSTAWFRAEATVAEASGEQAAPLLVTGVYVRSGGAWQLVNAHISTPRPPTSPPEA